MCSSDLYAQRITGSGSIPAHWPVNGAPVCISQSLQYPYAICPDSLGGAIIMWLDAGGITTNQSKAQRIDRFGALGNAEPVLARIADVPKDQGGKVQLTWRASYLDADPDYAVGSYSIWRSTTLAAAQRAVARGARWSGEEGLAKTPVAPKPG